MPREIEVPEYVRYLGRDVPKEGFRVFVYGPDDTQKLVNSWDEFQDVISSGIWFATKELVGKAVVQKVENIEPIKKGARK
jgi:hypothetical protein